MSPIYRISQHVSRNGHSRFGSHTFGQGLFAERRSTCPPYRLAILTLGLLNVVLLLAAAVIGIYCAKASDFQIPDSALTPLMVELNHLRNNTELVQAKEAAESALAKERDAHLQLKKQIREKLASTDSFQKIIQTLDEERQILQTNKTALDESCGRCPPGWRLLKSHCYFYTYHSILHVSLRRNWNDSRADCISKGGDLAVMDDPEEQAQVAQLLSNPNVARGPNWRESGFWVGLTNRQADGTWAWINSGKSFNSTQFAYREPRVNGSQGEDCGVHFQYFEQRSFHHADCQQQLLSWICSMEPKRV
ncbi:CD209 antigen-like protein E [Salarias fasciatus]|uniref:CD209 antigen-like protein E n=1 Tax=Salarias fasciatus TaxID=181472 RepID=UPI0011765798|nr:CD209 antigen-like protein E [Salarias fasciatus]